MTVNDTKFADFTDISPENDRGVLKKITRPGTSTVKPCRKDTVYVHYVGTYVGGAEDGKQFDSSRDRGDLFHFTLGTGDVIKAWDIGVATMNLGEMCELIVASEYGYNDEKIMKFEIELFSTEGEDVSLAKDGSVRKSVLVEGEKYANPTVCGEVTLSFNVLGSDDVHRETYTVGDPNLAKVPAGIDVAIRKMTYKERSRVVITDKAHLSGDAKPCASYEVTVESFEKFKRINAIEKFPDQVAYANTLKERANSFLKVQKYLVAVECYKRIDEDLAYLVTNGLAEKKTLDEVKLAIYNNCSLAYLKLNEVDKCLEMCQKAIDVDFKNEKALFRFGQAELLRKDHDEALKYFRKCLHEFPENSAAAAQVKFCESTISQSKAEEKKRFRGIFAKCKETGLGVVEVNNNEQEDEEGATSSGQEEEEEN